MSGSCGSNWNRAGSCFAGGGCAFSARIRSRASFCDEEAGTVTEVGAVLVAGSGLAGNSGIICGSVPCLPGARFHEIVNGARGNGQLQMLPEKGGNLVIRSSLLAQFANHFGMRLELRARCPFGHLVEQLA